MKNIILTVLVTIVSTIVSAEIPFEAETLSFMSEVGVEVGSSTNAISSLTPPSSFVSQQISFDQEAGSMETGFLYSASGSSTNLPQARIRVFVYDSETDARKQTCLALGGASSNPRIAQHYCSDNRGKNLVLIRKYETPGISTNCLANWCCSIAFNMAVWVQSDNCSAANLCLDFLTAAGIPVPENQ